MYNISYDKDTPLVSYKLVNYIIVAQYNIPAIYIYIPAVSNLINHT